MFVAMSLEVCCLPNTRTELYADRVMCCPQVSHVEFAPRALLRLEKTRQTDVRQTVNYITLTADSASVIIAIVH